MTEKETNLRNIGFPVFESEEERVEHLSKMINRGAIPVKDLELFKTYKGICRNASEAVWDGEKFNYKRYKFGIVFDEYIEHFENETQGYDAFIPYEKINLK